MSNKLAKIIKTEIDKQSLLKKNFEELDKVASIQRKVAFDWNKVHIYIYRIKMSNKNGFGMARPCLSCMGLIKELGIREINYTTEDGFASETLYK